MGKKLKSEVERGIKKSSEMYNKHSSDGKSTGGVWKQYGNINIWISISYIFKITIEDAFRDIY